MTNPAPVAEKRLKDNILKLINSTQYRPLIAVALEIGDARVHQLIKLNSPRLASQKVLEVIMQITGHTDPSVLIESDTAA